MGIKLMTLEEQLKQYQTWIKHHQKSAENSLNEKNEALKKLKKANEKIKELKKFKDEIAWAFNNYDTFELENRLTNIFDKMDGNND